MSPYQIELLMELWHSPLKPRRPNQDYMAQTVAEFIADGLLETCDQNESGVRATPRLDKYMGALQAVPLPRLEWVIDWPK